MNLKVVLLLFLVFFATATTIVLINAIIVPNHLKITLSTSLFNAIEPTGGGAVDDPTGV
jgi:hypothetical protein